MCRFIANESIFLLLSNLPPALLRTLTLSLGRGFFLFVFYLPDCLFGWLSLPLSNSLLPFSLHHASCRPSFSTGLCRQMDVHGRRALEVFFCVFLTSSTHEGLEVNLMLFGSKRYLVKSSMQMEPKRLEKSPNGLHITALRASIFGQESDCTLSQFFAEKLLCMPEVHPNDVYTLAQLYYQQVCRFPRPTMQEI